MIDLLITSKSSTKDILRWIDAVNRIPASYAGNGWGISEEMEDQVRTAINNKFRDMLQDDNISDYDVPYVRKEQRLNASGNAIENTGYIQLEKNDKTVEAIRRRMEHREMEMSLQKLEDPDYQGGTFVKYLNETPTREGQFQTIERQMLKNKQLSEKLEKLEAEQAFTKPDSKKYEKLEKKIQETRIELSKNPVVSEDGPEIQSIPKYTKKMKEKYTKEEWEDKVNKIKESNQRAVAAEMERRREVNDAYGVMKASKAMAASGSMGLLDHIYQDVDENGNLVHEGLRNEILGQHERFTWDWVTRAKSSVYNWEHRSE